MNRKVVRTLLLVLGIGFIILSTGNSFFKITGNAIYGDSNCVGNECTLFHVSSINVDFNSQTYTLNMQVSLTQNASGDWVPEGYIVYVTDASGGGGNVFLQKINDEKEVAGLSLTLEEELVNNSLAEPFYIKVSLAQGTQPECTVDSDCQTGYECTNGNCTEVVVQPECTVDSDCQNGYECSNGNCVEIDYNGPCSTDDDCQIGYECLGMYCEEKVETGCTDSDGGKDYYVKGTTEIVYNAFSSTSNEDECQNDDYLYEQYCSNGAIEYETHYCDQGCLNGECISSQSCSIDEDCSNRYWCSGGECKRITLLDKGECFENTCTLYHAFDEDHRHLYNSIEFEGESDIYHVYILGTNRGITFSIGNGDKTRRVEDLKEGDSQKKLGLRIVVDEIKEIQDNAYRVKISLYEEKNPYTNILVLAGTILVIFLLILWAIKKER